MSSAGRWRDREAYAARSHVVREDLSQLIVADAADIGGLAAEMRDACHGVGCRAPGCLQAWPHAGVELLGARLVNQRHAALDQPVLCEKLVARLSQDVDDRVADAYDVEFMVSHRR
jgi:hypothetical protein